MKVAIITNVIPHYRRGFYDRLEVSGLDYTVFCQDRLPGFNLHLIHDEVPGVSLVRFLGSERRLVWQFLPVLRLLRDYDVFVFYGNPRVLSSVLWATVFKALGKRVILWGQGHSAGGWGLSERLRLAWWRQFDLMVYTDREAEALRSDGFPHVVGLNNGLDQRAIDREANKWDKRRLAWWQKGWALDGRRVLLSIGQLAPGKEHDLMLNALARLVPAFPDLVWVVIGDGPERERLQEYNPALNAHIRWLGAVYDEAELAPWFLTAQAFVHCGPVGLSLLHAFGYGLPAIIHDESENHGPEAAALQHGVNGLSFQRGSVRSLVQTIGAILMNPSLRGWMGYDARRTVRERYNVDVMAQRFLKEMNR